MSTTPLKGDALRAISGSWEVPFRGFSCIAFFLFCTLALALHSCYSFNGGTVGNAKTAYVGFFKNEALNVNPALAQILTDKLKDKLIRETRLQLINADTADMQFNATITGYTTSPSSVGSGDVTLKTKLTITLNVKFVNRTDKKKNFESTVSSFSEYDASKTLSEVEATVVDEAGTRVVQEIYNKALNNW